MKFIETKFKLIGIFLVAILLFGCSQNYSVSEKKECTYVLNTSSKKVHIETCKSVKLMSDNNKKIIVNYLGNIISDGYVICQNCNAGVKANTILADKNTYLEKIDEISNWYVSNVATYQKDLQITALSEYDGKCEYIKKIELKDEKKKTKTYNVMTNDKNSTNIQNIDKDNFFILRATENAVMNYKNNYNDIDFGKHLAYYPCDFLKDSKSDYKMVGDDCVRYFFTIMDSINPYFTSNLKLYGKENWDKINSKRLTTDDKNIIVAMCKNGFIVYDKKKIVLKNREKEVFETNIIDSNFQLKKGDVLSRSGHIQIYLGAGRNDANDFGWGKVQNKFPTNNVYNLVNDEKGYFLTIESESNKGLPYKQYTRIFRYVGNVEIGYEYQE